LFFKNLPSDKVPLNETTKILKNHNALDFHKTLSEYKPTPLIELPNLSKKLGVKNIYVKDESKFDFGKYTIQELPSDSIIYDINY